MTATDVDIPLRGAIDDKVTPEPDDERYWSVTTVIGCLDKPAIPRWTAIKVAEAAVDQADAVAARLEHEGRESAIDFLKNAPYRTGKGRRSATKLGTDVHAVCEQYALTGIKPIVDDELRPFLDQYDRFLDEFQPEYVAAEMTVYNRTYGYAGTADAILSIEGEPLIADYKTSRESYDHDGKPRGPYPEVALQLAAYRFAELAAVWRARRNEQFKRRYYLLNPVEVAQAVPVPEVAGGIAIYLTPDRYAVHPIRCDEVVWDAFLHVQDAARWAFGTSASVIGHPMLVPHPLTEPTDDPFVGLPRE